MQDEVDPAIVPPPLLLEEAPDDEAPPLQFRWVRLLLVLIAAGWIAVFMVAIVLNPYRGGRVWLEETHRQLGFPSCHFKEMAGLPCPSCGMTSSFALLVRGDLVNSLRANFAGTLLALIGLAYLPWCAASLWRGQWLFFRTIEPVLIGLVVLFVSVMLLRWLGVLAWQFFGR